jgi:S-adenosylmethionine decarboxylase
MLSATTATTGSAVAHRFSPDDYAGVEWVVDAFGCSAETARSIETLSTLAARLIRDLDLHPAAPPLWRSFDGGGGVTGLILLSESHFTCHSFPELGFIAFNLYCCRQRSAWAWEEHVAQLFGATRVQVRELVRGSPPPRTVRAAEDHG